MRGARAFPGRRGLLALLVLYAAPLPSGAQGSVDLEGLGFLAGCWEGPFGSEEPRGVMEEFWTRPSKNLILGTTRYLQGDRTVFYELTRIQAVEEGVVMTPYPDGRASEDGFRLTSLEAARAVFEAPEHDFPRRIIYQDEPGGKRVVRIDDGSEDGRAREWRMRSVPCPGGS